MPIQFVAIAAAAARGAVAALNIGARAAGTGSRALVNGLGSFIIGQVKGGLSSEAGYWMNAITQNSIPDVAALVRAYWTGHIDLGTLAHNCHWNNVPFRGFDNAQGNFNRETWRGVLASTRPELEASTIVDLFHEDVIDDIEATARLRRHGITWLDANRLLLRNRGWFDLGAAVTLYHQGVLGIGEYEAAVHRAGISQPEAVAAMLTQVPVAPLASWQSWWLAGWVSDDAYWARLKREGHNSLADRERWLLMRQPPPMDIVTGDYHTGRATPDETRDRMALHGYGRELEQRAILKHERPWSVSEAVNLFWRGAAGDEVLHTAFSFNGIQEQNRQLMAFNAMRPIPDSGSLITMAVHEVWDNDVVNTFGYDAEFPPQFQFWMSQQGWDWTQQVPDFQGNLQPGVPWPILYWRAHWRPMSPTQGYRALHRLRPDRIARYADRVPGLEPFLWADMERVLRIADYPPKLRRWLAASSFAVLPIYVVRSLYRNGERDRSWLIDQFRDRGFSQEDAEATADDEDAKAREKRLKVGEKEREKARQRLIDTIVRAYRIGAISAVAAVARLRQQKMRRADAEAIINLTAAEANVELVDAGIKRLKRAYMAGEWHPTAIAGQLRAMGIQPDATARYVAQWNLERGQTRRMLSTEKIVAWAGDGRLTMDQAAERLTNLGWRSPDVLLMLSEARTKLADMVAKKDAAQEKAIGKRQADLEAIDKQARGLRLSIQAQLRRETPLASLKKWICQAIVSAEWASDRMTAMGYPDEQVEQYLKQWALDNVADKKCLPAKVDKAETADQANHLPEAPAPSGKIPQPTGAEKLVGGTVQIGNQPPSDS